ncbi:MAG: rhamnan synthesis F family protein [Nitrosomonas sp.]|uniref:rhamnan synthesis F family protein n=1 Tax=Nitrosomonas sp. TaxID=42353 RepID=UPI002732C971|nr:rhamnan synthesis F family protein [Nitrosomonas sp.]MDP3662785.1 rhamnan synthesis F family protein [Nitrosomonas sp.]MDZ4107650.1 rhamnan synthesis F family protein [Nitrosomonas sp.]
MENLLVPNQASTNIPCTHALVFAPHPDDEVFGCGGAIMRHIEQNVPVRVIIVSDGAHGVSDENKTEYTQQRRNESITAAHLLGYGMPIFWQYQDRQVCYSEKLIQEILTAIRETGADLVYAPSIFEMHPDHRAMGMAVVEAIRRIGKAVRVALYEVGIPLRPNLLLDISDLAARKTAAMECFVSQNARQRYDQHITALNRYRTYTLPASVSAAEAYIVIPAEELTNDPLKLYQPEHTRQKALGLVLGSSDMPLVSIIIRSMDRPTLSDALDSVALQTYPNIEVVLVNAKGAGHREVSEWCGRFPIQVTTNYESLNRSQAANIGLNTAQGNYLIFLDDDDLFYPEHIATLVAALQNHSNIRCAYSGVRVEYYVDQQLQTVTAFNEPYNQHRLWGRNFIPIHAMLFEQSLVTKDHCGFDENLKVFEDWDFWIQLTQHSDILHIDKITAIYRNYGHSGLGLKQDESFLKESRSKVYNKWKMLLTGEQLEELIQYREDAIASLRSRLTDSDLQIAFLQDRLKQDALASTQREQSLHNEIEILQETIEKLHEKINNLHKITIDLNKTISNLFHSTSWKITAPLRFLIRIIRGQHHDAWDGLRRRILPVLKIIYWRLPRRLRNKVLDIAYRIAGPLFSGMGHYELWRATKVDFVEQLSMDSGGFLAGMIDLSTIAPMTTPPSGRIAIHTHIFYADLAAEFAKYLGQMPFQYDLFVSTPNEATSQMCKQAFSHLPHLGQLTVTIVPNRGRDIAPMFCTFGELLQRYDYIAHIHSKKSLYNDGATDGWREYLLTNLLGSKSQIQKIFALLTGDKTVGFVYPQNFTALPYIANSWLSNKACGHFWCTKLGITKIPTGYFDFPAGSMFWARTEALQPLFNANIKVEDFPEEAGQTDATLAHCIERLFVLVTRRSGFNAAILRDSKSASWSRWHFEQYLLRKQENIHAMLADPDLRVVVFDIFDTLLTRPLLNPEHIKNIVAQRAGGEAGRLYLELRANAETQARQKAGRDIGLDAIFAEFSVLAELPSAAVQQLRNLEEAIELEIVSPRPETIALLQYAISLGKRVILASDMYLPKPFIEKMLQRNGINGWHEFYLSSDNGLRKDTGDFYRQLLIQEGVSPNEVIIIGDNEHSDVQVPGDMGIKYLHIMRPVELARAIPRLGPVIERSSYCDDLNKQLTLGTIVQGNFHSFFYPRFNPSDLVPATPWAIGFTVAGPLILSFVQWLAKKAAADGIQRLYFLAREGQILKLVYDQWVSNNANAIASDYLVLSRRAITVPMITNLEEIYRIARTRYFPNHLPKFLHERYGLILSSEEREDFVQSGLWTDNKLVSVENENIDHLIPVLQALEERIMKNAQSERPGLLAYLNNLSLNSASTSAIVDIGYSATVQGYLNHLLNRKIHGYYLMTQERAKQVSSQYKVITQGYFGHYVDPRINSPLILRESFSLEKLLSSDDAQIVCYRQTDSGDIVPEFRQLADEERRSSLTRTEIRRGIMDFVAQSITIRDKLISNFEIPPDIPTALFEELIEHPSQSEKDILGALVLDDHYCGRGLVS